MKGYKIASKVGEKYFSFFTGIEYKINKDIQTVSTLKDLTKYRKANSFVDVFWDSVILFGHNSHIDSLVGRTTVFKNIEDASEFMDDIKIHDVHGMVDLVLLETSFDSRNVISGKYSNDRRLLDVFYVKQFKEIKEIELN